MRPVIWVILAVLVVAAIIFTVIARRGSTPAGTIQRSTEDYIRFADRADKRAERLEERIASLVQEGLPPNAQPMLDQLNNKMSELKSAISDLRGTPNEENYTKVQDLYRDAKKMYRDMGGVGEEEGEE